MKINRIYLDHEIKCQMKEFFESEGFLQLNDFIQKNNLTNIKKNILEQDLKEIYNPILIKKKQMFKKDTYNHEILKLIEFFSSKDFIQFIEEILDLELMLHKIELNIYSHKDFILLSDYAKKDETIDIIFDLSDTWNEFYGGILTYTTNEEEVFYLEPSFNTLTFLYKPEEIMKYLKYVNNLAKNKKIIRLEIELKIKEEI